MTLVLSLVTRDFVLHVSDRLVTRRTYSRTPSFRAFDGNSNKAIVYRAANAVVAIGYSGNAYIGGRPTDQWIAEALFRQRFEPVLPNGGPATTYLGGSGYAFELGRSLRLILAEASKRLAMQREASLQLVVVGWQTWMQRRCRPISQEFRWNATSGNFDAGSLPRHWWHPTRAADGTKRWPFVLRYAPDGVVPSTSCDDAMHQLNDVWQSPERCADVLVDLLRQRAHRDAAIGSECMIICLQREPNIHVTFSALRPPVGRVRTTGQRIPVTFSPWLIGPQLGVPPSVISGHFNADLGGVAVTVHGPPPAKQGVLSYFAGQRRPGEPR